MVLKLRKTKLGLSYEQIAEIADMAPGTAKRLLHGQRDVSIKQLVGLAKALQTTPYEIVDAASKRVQNTSL